MKTLPAVVICFIAAGLSPAQTAAPAGPPHGLVTLKLTWSREVSPPLPTGSRQDEVSGPAGRDDSNGDPVDKLRTPTPIPGSPFPGQMKLHYFYVYSLKVRNESGKKIRGVFWDYVAADPDSGAELNRHRFINIQEIIPGEVATLRAKASSAPTDLVTAGGLGKDARSPFASIAEIRCVLYTDATMWELNRGDKLCEQLRRAGARALGRKGKRP
jgi:hypothetical protein